MAEENRTEREFTLRLMIISYLLRLTNAENDPDEMLRLYSESTGLPPVEFIDKVNAEQERRH